MTKANLKPGEIANIPAEQAIVNATNDNKEVAGIASSTAEQATTIQAATEGPSETDLIQRFFTNGKIDMHGLSKALKLGDHEPGWHPSHKGEFMERFFKFMGEANANGQYTELLSRITDAFIDLEGISSGHWCHSLCHFFEEYLMREHPTFLSSKFNLPAAKKLVEVGVQRSVESKRFGNMSRVIFPLIRYNIEHLDLEKLDEDFAFKPGCLNNPEFKDLEKPENSSESEFSKSQKLDTLRLFLNAKNPREMMLNIILEDFACLDQDEPTLKIQRIEGIKIHMPIEKLIALLEKLKPEITDEQAQIYLRIVTKKTEGCEEHVDDFMANLEKAREAKVLAEGLFVDVDGTLVGVPQWTQIKVIELMKTAKSQGKKVTIFSGGDPEIQTEKLRDMGISEEFLPVQSKQDYRGKILENLIDDTPPEIQGFRALVYTMPS